MKLKDYPGFMETLPVLFEHLKKHGIESGYDRKPDFRRILELLMDSELDRSFYRADFPWHRVFFHGYRCDGEEKYFFVFGRGDDPARHFLDISVSEDGSGSITLLFNDAMMLPIARGLQGPDGRVAITVVDEESGTERVEYEQVEIFNEEQLEEFIWDCTRGYSENFIINDWNTW